MRSPLLAVCVCVLLSAGTGFRLEIGDGRLCAFTNSPQGAEPALTNELRGELQANDTIRCSQGSRCYGLWEKRADGELRLLNQGCWTHVGSQLECRSTVCVPVGAPPSHLWKNNYRFCCCNHDLCNSNYTEAPPTADTPNLRPMKDHAPTDKLSQEETALIALVTVAIAAIIILALFLGYSMMRRRRKLGLSAVEETEETNHNHLDLENLKLLELIGRGRYGAVFRGSLKERCVAVKVFSSANRQNFTNERSIYQLPLLQQHHNIAHFLTGQERDAEGRPEFLIIMEFYPQGSLSRFLSVHTVDWSTCCKLTLDVTRGLAFLHTELYRGEEYKPAVAHRDLSSRNVLVRADLSCVLADFGLSMTLTGTCSCRHGDEDNMTISEVGTVRYMAPEVLGGALNLRDCESALKQVDVYALGLLCWESFRRCSELYPGEMVPDYQLAYQAELGNHPTFEEMQVLVSREKFRPRFPEAWKENNLALRSLKETIDDCWDQDAEARLTAQCAEERLSELTLLGTHTAVHNHRNLSAGRWPPLGSASSYIEDLQVEKNQVVRTSPFGLDRNSINYERQQSRLTDANNLNTHNANPQQTGGAVLSVPGYLQLTPEDLKTSRLDPEEVRIVLGPPLNTCCHVDGKLNKDRSEDCDEDLREDCDEDLMEDFQKDFSLQSGALLDSQAVASPPQPSAPHLPHRPTSLHLPRVRLGRMKTNKQVETGVAKMNTVTVVVAAEPHLVTMVTNSTNSGTEDRPITVITGAPTLVTNEAAGGGRTNPAGPQEEEEEEAERAEGLLNLLNFSPDEHEPLLRRNQTGSDHQRPGSNSNNNNNRTGSGPQAQGPGFDPPGRRRRRFPEVDQCGRTRDQNPAGGPASGFPALGSGLVSDQVTGSTRKDPDPGDGLQEAPETEVPSGLDPDCSDPDPVSLQALGTGNPQPSEASSLPPEDPASNPGTTPPEIGSGSPGSRAPPPPYSPQSPNLDSLAAGLLRSQQGQTRSRRPERPCSLDLTLTCCSSDVTQPDGGVLSASGEKIKRRVKTPYTLKKWRPASWVVSTDSALDPEFEFNIGSAQSGLKINQSKSSMAVFLVGGGATATTTSEPDGMTSF